MSQKSQNKQYNTGAVRSGDCEDYRYDLISPIGLQSLAETYAEGVKKFGYCNWENGMPVCDLLNHAIAHIYKYLSGDRAENHLGHAAWNIIGAIHSEQLWPHLNENLLRGPNCKAPKAAEETAGHVAVPATSCTEHSDTRRHTAEDGDLSSLRAAIMKTEL